jgi:hypothetical protein
MAFDRKTLGILSLILTVLSTTKVSIRTVSLVTFRKTTLYLLGGIVTLGSNFVIVILSVVGVKVLAPFSSNPREPIEKGLGRKKSLEMKFEIENSLSFLCEVFWPAVLAKW